MRALDADKQPTSAEIMAALTALRALLDKHGAEAVRDAVRELNAALKAVEGA